MISCSNYDFVEIACMHRYPIKLTMKTGVTLECIAVDTKNNEARQECIKVNVNGTETLVRLDSISKLEVCVENQHFKEIYFS
ncbi:MAG: Rho-binding antiterminator [Bacteroidota bacterium]